MLSKRERCKQLLLRWVCLHRCGSWSAAAGLSSWSSSTWTSSPPAAGSLRSTEDLLSHCSPKCWSWTLSLSGAAAETGSESQLRGVSWLPTVVLSQDAADRSYSRMQRCVIITHIWCLMFTCCRLCGAHVLHMSAWVLSALSSFLPLSKHMHVWLTGCRRGHDWPRLFPVTLTEVSEWWKHRQVAQRAELFLFWKKDLWNNKDDAGLSQSWFWKHWTAFSLRHYKQTVFVFFSLLLFFSDSGGDETLHISACSKNNAFITCSMVQWTACWTAKTLPKKLFKGCGFESRHSRYIKIHQTS